MCDSRVRARTRIPYSQGMSLSTKRNECAPQGRRFERVFWVVLDGMGYEHARRLVSAGRFPALTRIARDGYLGPSQPPSPVCQTPPALLALFSGTEPAENGIWGYHMPDPRKQEGSVSGFSAQPTGGSLIWEELESRAVGYSLMNVMFRNDPLWARCSSRLDFGYDGYRLWGKPGFYSLDGGKAENSYRGIRFRTIPRGGGLCIAKGSEIRARLRPGRGALVNLTAETRVFAQQLDPSLLILSPLNKAMIRGAVPALDGTSDGTLNGFLDANAFRASRGLNRDRRPAARIPLPAELLLSTASMKQKTDLMLAAASGTHSRLVVGYFPLIDEYNHAYVDMLESEWPQAEGQPEREGAVTEGPGRATEVFLGCAALVDDLLARLMAVVGPDTLLVVSSDHGAMPHRSVLHVNELFAGSGLVRRRVGGSSPNGYDLRRSVAYYHPSDCGQVVVNETEARRRGFDRAGLLSRVRAIADNAGAGLLEGAPQLPYIAFLFPLGDRYFTGRPPRHGRPALDAEKAGGHHLSPLSPTPWIQAVLGLWSSGAAAGAFGGAPTANRDLKSYLLALMGVP
jgi:hypothetical protein